MEFKECLKLNKWKIGILILVLFSLIYITYLYQGNKSNYEKSYTNYYNYCIDKNDVNNVILQAPAEIKIILIKEVNSCKAKNGCYETCGSGCGLPSNKYSIKLFIDEYLDKIFKFWISGACNTVCTEGCLLPFEK